MAAFLFSLLIGLCWIRGFSLATSPGMVLGFVTKWNNKQINKNKATITRLHRQAKGQTEGGKMMVFVKGWRKTQREIFRTRFKSFLSKPFFACIYCMASVHGTIIYFGIQIGFGLDWPLYLWPMYILALSGLVEISVKLFDYKSYD